jgi:hypothetical protein
MTVRGIAHLPPRILVETPVKLYENPEEQG